MLIFDRSRITNFIRKIFVNKQNGVSSTDWFPSYERKKQIIKTYYEERKMIMKSHITDSKNVLSIMPPITEWSMMDGLNWAVDYKQTRKDGIYISVEMIITSVLNWMLEKIWIVHLLGKNIIIMVMVTLFLMHICQSMKYHHLIGCVWIRMYHQEWIYHPYVPHLLSLHTIWKENCVFVYLIIIWKN